MVRNFFLIFLLLLSFSCNRTENKPAPIINLTHENGLTLSIAAHLKISKTHDGFIIYPQGGLERRSPIQVLVSFNLGQKPEGDWPHSKSLNGSTIFYRENSQSGGSGGPEYTLEAWKNCVGGYIKAEQTVQIEHGNPDFSLTWQVISNADKT